MKNYYALTLLIILSLFLPPFQSLHANLVPIEKSNYQTKKSTKKAHRQTLKKAQQKFKKQRKKYKKSTHKPEQQNGYGALWALLIGLISFYVIGAIVFIIVGFVFTIPALWITGICLLGVPLLISIISGIISAIEVSKYKKEQEEAKRLRKNLNE